MAALKILALSILAAIGYGIAFDQVTARICVEYFTIGHPPIFATESPTLLALGWGILATWWVGLGLGLPLAFASLRGPWPRRDAAYLARPIARLLVQMAAFAALAGTVGWLAARADYVFLLAPLAERVPQERHDAFVADLWAHSASYLYGFVGGVLLIRRVWRERQAESRARAQPNNSSSTTDRKPTTP